MLQHLTSRSFFWPHLEITLNVCEMSRQLDSTTFCILFRIPLNRARRSYSSRNLAPRTTPPNKKNVLDDVQLFGLVAWVLFGKLPQQWLVLLCLLRILLRVIVQPWTAHFHSQHPHRLVVYKSHVLSVGSNESVFCVNRNIPVCLTVYWLVQRFGLHLWGGTESASLRPPQHVKEQHLKCRIMPVHVLSLCQRWTSSQNVSMAFWYLSGTAHSAQGVNLVWSTGLIRGINSGWKNCS